MNKKIIINYMFLLIKILYIILRGLTEYQQNIESNDNLLDSIRWGKPIWTWVF